MLKTITFWKLEFYQSSIGTYVQKEQTLRHVFLCSGVQIGVNNYQIHSIMVLYAGKCFLSH